MSPFQPGIMAPVPGQARFQEFRLKASADGRAALRALAAEPFGDRLVIGLGPALAGQVTALKAFPAREGAVSIPSTQADLWCWYRGEDRGDILHLSRHVAGLLATDFNPCLTLDGFRYQSGLDLTGYVDGTENPTGDDAEVAAFLGSDAGDGLAGSSFLAVQQWVHDLDVFDALPASEQDDIIGRRKADNEEFDEAPDTAHVKRTAQESFDPEAFVLRRSMPFVDGDQAGLVFTAFGHSFDAFEALLGRMTGEEDGQIDGLFRFTRPVTGSYFWCPPVKDGKLNLSAIEL